MTAEQGTFSALRIATTSLPPARRLPAQILFEEQGTTFGEFVTERRLDSARAMLLSPRYAGWSIAGIAFEAGFKDLSHFNRRFRLRFGATPSELRRQA